MNPTSGDDSNTGSLTSPVASLQRAVIIAVSGDTIFLNTGTYTGSLNREIEVNKKELIFQSVSLDKSDVVLDLEKSGRAFTLSRMQRVLIRHISIINGGGVDVGKLKLCKKVCEE